MSSQWHEEWPVLVKLPVQWGDQDAFGHVNNTVFLRWFESARIAFLSHIGLSHLMETQGIGAILAAVQCNYRRQVHYPDTVHVGARLGRIGRTSVILHHEVYSETIGGVVTDGESTVVVFDYREQRPLRIPAEVQARLESH